MDSFRVRINGVTGNVSGIMLTLSCRLAVCLLGTLGLSPRGVCRRLSGGLVWPLVWGLTVGPLSALMVIGGLMKRNCLRLKFV